MKLARPPLTLALLLIGMLASAGEPCVAPAACATADPGPGLEPASVAEFEGTASPSASTVAIAVEDAGLAAQPGSGPAAAAGGLRHETGYGRLTMCFEPNQGQSDASVRFLARGPGYQLFLTPEEAVLVLRQAPPAQPPGTLRGNPASLPALGREQVGSAASAARPATSPFPAEALSLAAASALDLTEALYPAAAGVAALAKALYPAAVSAMVAAEVPPAAIASTAAPATTPPTAAAIRLRLEGSHRNATPTLAGEEPLHGYSNYLIGPDPANWRTRVPHYAKVRYAEVYPGIDLVYYGNPQQLEYDFVVAPGADPGLIQLAFTGVEGLEIDAAGNLILNVAGGRLVQQAPRIWQVIDGERLPVEGRYVLRQPDGERLAFQPAAEESPTLVGFQIAHYQPELPLVIDPVVLSYSTFVGGSSADFGYAIAVDSGGGQAYVTGSTYSADFPVTADAAAISNAGNYDVFVAKLNAAGTALIYATYFGGLYEDSGLGIAVNGEGQAYVSGYTDSYDFPVTEGAIETSYTGSRDAFIAKFNAAGTALDYATFLGGNSDDYGRGIAVDGEGDAYVTGDTSSPNFPTTLGAAYTSSAGGSDTFIAKLNAAGTALDYATFLGGNSADSGRGIAVNGAGDAYVTGDTSSSNFPTTLGAAYTSSAGGLDTFIAKLNAAGTALDFATYLGGRGNDYAAGVAVDARGLAYVTGHTDSDDFPIRNATNPNWSGISDAFLVVLSPDGGGLVYGTYLGGTEFDLGASVAVDSAGNAFVTGYSYSGDFPTTAGSKNYSYDAFIAKFLIDGKLLLVNPTGGGSGLINSTLPDETVDCGQTCSAIYPANTAVRLLAATQPVSTFTGWGGDCAAAGTALTCNLTLATDRTVSANFVPRTDDIGISQVLDLDQSLPGIDWYQAGSATWFAQDRVTHDGVDAAQSGAIGDNQSSELEATVTGPANLSFWWKVSSEPNWDYLRFYLDGVAQGAISGESDWTSFALHIPAGAHTLTWAYEKDENGRGGQDAGWLDQVVFDNAPRTLTLDPTLGGTIAGAASGSYPLDSAFTLEATPAAGYYFGGWGGDCAGAHLAASCELTLDADKRVSATFIAELQGEATGVAAGGAHSCAVAAGGVRCWGDNESGQLGNGTTFDSPVPLQALPPGSGATAVAAGGSHSCALVDGGVQCWGSGGSGQLGNGSYSSSATPVQVIPAGSGATAIAAGNSHSCAVVDGGVQCWGNGWYGQLGNGIWGSSAATPVQAIPAGKGATTVAAGGDHSCAVVDGGVKCWGLGDYGKLGNGSYSSSATPVQALPAGSGATAVAGGESHSCAVVAGGVQCWGAGGSGQLGNGSYSSSATPVQALPAGGGATAVTAGESHSCALVAGGVQCWGDGRYGQLGTGSSGWGYNSTTPVQAFHAGSGATAVAAGGNWDGLFWVDGHSCALVAGGVQCWGYGGSGRLGNGTQDDSARPRQVYGLWGDLGPGIPVTATAGPGGSISPLWVNVPSGETTTFIVTPDPGYHLDTVIGCDGTLDGSRYTTGPITAACSVSATFAPNSYSIDATASPTGGGSVTCAPDMVAHGGTSHCSADIASGYGFVNWGGDCAGTGPECTLTDITGPRQVTAHFVDLSATLSVMQSAPSYGAGSLLTVSASLDDRSGTSPLSLLWRPRLPDGWTLQAVSGPGAPEVSPDGSEILFTGSLGGMPLDFSYQVAVPAAATGQQVIAARVHYQNGTMANPVTLAAAPNPLTLEPSLYHSADYAEARWQIDGSEASRVLAYWRAGAYRANAAGEDGFAPGTTGGSDRSRHSADYQSPYWVIDSSEANRVLAYWRAAAYHADPAGADGYAPGIAPAALVMGMASPALAGELASLTVGASHSAPDYVPGGTLTLTNTLDRPADGTLLSLLWTPDLPVGWTISAVSGDGGPELGPDGRSILFTGSLTANPLTFTYQVAVPADASGQHGLSAEVEYQTAAAVNALALSAQPQPLVVAEMDAEENLTIHGADVPASGVHAFVANGNITVLGEVLVRNGVELKLSAGKKIVFLPGFRVQAGGRLGARIGTSP